MECPNCHTVTPTHVGFCANCGFDFPVEETGETGGPTEEGNRCPHCNASNPDNIAFCSLCGADLRDDTPGSAGTDTDAVPFFPAEGMPIPTPTGAQDDFGPRDDERPLPSLGDFLTASYSAGVITTAIAVAARSLLAGLALFAAFFLGGLLLRTVPWAPLWICIYSLVISLYCYGWAVKPVFALCEAEINNMRSPRPDNWSNLGVGVPLVVFYLAGMVPGIIVLLIGLSSESGGMMVLGNMLASFGAMLTGPIGCLSVVHAGGSIDGYNPLKILKWLAALTIHYLGVVGILTLNLVAMVLVSMLGVFLMNQAGPIVGGLVMFLLITGLFGYMLSYQFLMLGLLYRRYAHALGDPRATPPTSGRSPAVLGLPVMILVMAITVVGNIQNAAKMNQFGSMFDRKDDSWTDSYQMAMLLSAQSERPIMVYFTSRNDLDAQSFDRDIVSDPAFLTWAKPRLVLLRIEIEGFNARHILEKKALGNLLDGKRINVPSIILTDKSGEALGKVDCNQNSPDELIYALEKGFQ